MLLTDDRLPIAVRHLKRRRRFVPFILRVQRADGSNREQGRHDEEGFGSHSTTQLSNDAAIDNTPLTAKIRPFFARISTGVTADGRAAAPGMPFF